MTSFQQFIANHPARTFKKGETILLKDDTPKDMHVIESGLVKVYTITADGDERLVTFNRDEEDFPIGFSMGIVERSQYFYEAFTNCIIRLVPREEYLRYLSSDIEVMQKRMARLTILLISNYARVSALEQTRVSDKIARTLLYMADQFGVLMRPYNTRLQLSVTQQEIANSLGLTRETTNIELKKLEVKQLISYSRKTYILYTERLRKYLEDGH
jgi:CRP/FNR family transcriptional regulator